MKLDDVYFCTINEVSEKYAIPLKYGKIRTERDTVRARKQFTSNKLFKAFIIKCYVENDLDKRMKNKITKGRISHAVVTRYF